MATLNPSQIPTLREDGGLFRELDGNRSPPPHEIPSKAARYR